MVTLLLGGDDFGKWLVIVISNKGLNVVTSKEWLCNSILATISVSFRDNGNIIK